VSRRAAVTVNDVLRALDERFPFAHCADWDNVGIRTDGFQGGEHDGVVRHKEVGGAPSKAREHRRRGVERDEDRPHGSVGVAQQESDVVPVGAVGERETLIERPQHVVHRDRGAAVHAGTFLRVRPCIK
jgi:hypothetical protein